MQIYGIKNCDTMKKAFKWLDAHNLDYVFHDYKKSGANKEFLEQAIDAYGWETVINRRGTTWRKLSDDVRSSMNTELAVQSALEMPSLIKRPMIVTDDTILFGFDENIYAKTFL